MWLTIHYFRNKFGMLRRVRETGTDRYGYVYYPRRTFLQLATVRVRVLSPPYFLQRATTTALYGVTQLLKYTAPHRDNP